MRHNFPVTLILLGALCLASFSAAANAAVIAVSNTNDNMAGSARQAILDASPGDTIVFHIATSDPGYDPNTGIFTIGLTNGDLLINKTLMIDGGGQKIRVRRSSGSFRIFNIMAGNVTVSQLTIAGGLGVNGAGIRNASSGIVSVLGCTFDGNNASGANGGAIFNVTTLRISNCTFSGNVADLGGAIYNSAGATLAVDNSTLSANTTTFGAAFDNTSGGTARVRNTIVAVNVSMAAFRDVAGTFISEGYNLIGTGTGSTGFGAMGDQVGVSDAQASLTPLRDNGGPTKTIRPFPDSFAIDQGKRGLDSDNQPINVDQRGFARPIDLPLVVNASGGDGSDIGAVETGPLQDTETLIVTNTDSHHDGECTVDDCTLREAVFTANNNGDANTIVFAPNVRGIIINSFPGPGFTIFAPVSIVGPGARELTITALNAVRIFTVQSTGVSISGLTLTAGRVEADGGAIYNSATGLTLRDCTISNSRAVLTNGTFGNGGGLYNASGASVAVRDCTFSGNNAEQFGGGAIFNGGQVTATNCTFHGNSAPRGGAILSVSNNGTSLVTLQNCTITNNTASSAAGSTDGGGGYYGEGAVGNGLHHFSNTILAGNINAVNPDLRGYGTSEGNNLVGNLGQSGSGFSNGVNGDKAGTAAQPLNAQFGAFGNNGGPTDTRALLSNSPAINGGNDASAPATDQRHYSRSGVSDMGAFEFNGTSPPLVPLVSVASSKIHGAQTFGIDLPLTGGPGVECRSGGAHGAFTILFTFTNTVTNLGGVSLTSGAGTIAPATGINPADAHQYIVQLTGVVNAQILAIQLTNITDSLGNSTPLLQIPIGILLGDTTGNGSVNATDVSQAKLQSGQALAASNFRNDVTVNGSINATDISNVKLKSGTALPP